jgi:hypothetical protein
LDAAIVSVIASFVDKSRQRAGLDQARASRSNRPETFFDLSGLPAPAGLPVLFDPVRRICFGEIEMRKNVLAAALIAPALAFAPAAALAHHCKSYHHHHAKAEKGAFGSGKTMKKDKTGSQMNKDMNKDLNKDTNRSTGGTTY